jgi:hypothetical protein
MLSLLKSSDLLLECPSLLKRFRELWAFALVSIQHAPLGIYRPYYGANQFTFIHTTSLGICMQAGFWQWPTVGVCQRYGSIPPRFWRKIPESNRNVYYTIFMQLETPLYSTWSSMVPSSLNWWIPTSKAFTYLLGHVFDLGSRFSSAIERLTYR